MDRLRVLLVFLVFLGIASSANALYSVVDWKDQQVPLNQRLSTHKTLWVTTYQDVRGHNARFLSSFKVSELDVETLMTDREQSPVDSTGDIVKALRDHPEKQNLVCAGKAAADCLEALLQYPELWKKVNYFISLDGKISGAEYAENSKEPVATHDVQRASKLPLIKAFRFIVDTVLSWWDGYNPAVHSMSPKVRADYLEDNDSKIERLAEQVHVISMVTERGPYWKIPYSKTQFFVSF